MQRSATREIFGYTPDGTVVERIVLAHEDQIRVSIITFGAAVQALEIPDRAGKLDDIVLGHDDLQSYIDTRSFFGATIGRYANRIAGGSFVLDGQSVRLAQNDGANALHGGPGGFDRKIWSIVDVGADPSPFVILALSSEDGEEGYPGSLDVRLRYELSPGRVLSLDFDAWSDRRTIINLTHHGFFNLCGHSGRDVLGHELEIAADHYLPVDENLIPCGGPVPVEGTPFDFRNPLTIGQRIRSADAQLHIGNGYDHNYCLSADGRGRRRVARVFEPVSGRSMELETDQPGLQFYSGNYLGDGLVGKKGVLYRQSDAFCLEPQVWPDSPNRENFPSCVVEPGTPYSHRLAFRFG
jgi:aldose 1-epimerase